MLMKTDTAADVGVHVFEKAGLGLAPFRCVGVEYKTFQACPGAPVQVGGSCDYCGTGISIHCLIKSADGRRFKVGSDCVARTGDAGLLRSFKTRPEVRAAAKLKAKAKAERVAAEWSALISDESNRAKLASLPAMNNSPAANRLAQLEWIWARCGAAGRARWLKCLKATLAS